MDKLALAESLLNECESVVNFSVKTKGSGSHESPVVLLMETDADRIQRGNSSNDGLVTDDSGSVTGVRLATKFLSNPIIQAQSTNEVDAYQYASDLREHFTILEEWPEMLHADCLELSVGELKQKNPQVDPLPETTYKHYFRLDIRFKNTVVREITSDDNVQELTSITDDISLS
jgi:hypothetical protein